MVSTKLMAMAKIMVAVAVLARILLVDGFVPILPSKKPSPSAGIGQALSMTYYDDSSSSSSRDEALSRRTDIRNFLTQRSLQSFFNLLTLTRDPHTITWIEQTLDTQRLAEFHGTGALNMTKFPTWDSVFLDLVNRPIETIVVEVKRRGRSHRGWSNNQYLENLSNGGGNVTRSNENPYMEERWDEFEVDIDPPSLVTRIMSVREQISKEWLLDLQTIIDTNDDVLTKYQEHQEQARDNESNLSEENDETAKAKEELEKLIAKPYQDHDKTQEKLVFDQTAMMNFLKPTQVDSTPLRKKSFDLLILLCTQESIHRVLKEYAKEDKMDSVEFLSDFYGDRAGEFFDGPQEFGRADDFLQELFTEPPSIQEKSGGKVSFVDPMTITADIIRERSEVANEWMALLSDTTDDHTELHRMLLIRKIDETLKQEASNHAVVDNNPLPETDTTIRQTNDTVVVGIQGAFE